MPERLLRGLAASPGLGHGAARWLDPPPADAAATVPMPTRAAERERARAALEAAAAELDALAVRLAAEGRWAESEMVAAGGLMARDPLLAEGVDREVAAGRTAAAALQVATAALAEPLEALDDPMLALRADDLRSVGRRAARLTAAGPAMAPGNGSEPVVLVATDLGPADVAELGAGVAGVALAAGGVTAHAAIVARSLGLPMVVGLGAPLAAVPGGAPLVVDGDSGLLAVSPDGERVEAAERVRASRAVVVRRAREDRSLPATTLDGHRVRVLANVVGRTDVESALASGAEGVGLLRTELAFLGARAWPRREEHERLLRPALEPLAGRLATVRLLDFGGDKTPPFLRGRPGRGIELLLDAPDALVAQLEAIRAAAGAVELRVLVPMVTEPGQVREVRRLLGPAGAVGAMVEVPAAATLADRLATAADFLSLGTNDLASLELGRGRDVPGLAPAHHPAVLRRVAQVVAAAHEAGLPVEVCGEAASDPRALPLLVGLGVDELSVGVARVGWVRASVRGLSFEAARAVAGRALDAESASEVERLLDQAAHAVGQGR